MHISNKCNEESRGEYEIFNEVFDKQRVITDIGGDRTKWHRQNGSNFYRFQFN